MHLFFIITFKIALRILSGRCSEHFLLSCDATTTDDLLLGHLSTLKTAPQVKALGLTLIDQQFRFPVFFSVVTPPRRVSAVMAANGHNNVNIDDRIVFFFDIDNCLYPKSYQIHEKMSVLIDKYFQEHLSISQEEAYQLHQRYYRDYGLAIEGLVRHHKVDPLEYNRQVDDALPLDEVIKPNSQLRKLLQDIDTSRVRLWLFTNAYITHGKRVVKLLGVDDLFEGITYCDYGAEKLLCKPLPEMFAKAMREAGISRPASCYFVGTSGRTFVTGLY